LSCADFLAAGRCCVTSAATRWARAAAWDGRYPEVTVPGTAPREHAGLRVHRTRLLDVDDVRRVDGMRVTAPARTLLDLAARLDHRPLRRAVRQAQALHHVNTRDLLTILERLRGRRGSRTMRGIVATGPAPTRSELEDALLDLILRASLQHPDVNAPLILAGRRVIPDLRWPAQRLVVEADGAAWHDRRVAREDDLERQALLEAHGERVVRVTWEQVIARPAQTLARLRAAGAPTA